MKALGAFVLLMAILSPVIVTLCIGLDKREYIAKYERLAAIWVVVVMISFYLYTGHL